MRMAIVAHNLRVAGGLSVGLSVVSALARVADHHEYLLILPAGVGYEAAAKPTRATCRFYRRRAGFLGQLLFEQFRLPFLVRGFKPDVVWGLGNFGLVRPGVPQAMVLQQAYFVYDPSEQIKPIWRVSRITRYGAWRLARCLRATQIVFCQTKTMARRFAQAFGYSGQVALFSNAVSRTTRTGNAPRRPPIFDQLRGKFVLLCLSRYYTHKNLESLVTLFTQHGERLRDVAVVLTIAADQMPGAAKLLARIDELGLGGYLVNVGPIRQDELPEYFAASDGLILPTVLESFSGTYLEAMRFGRPILTSDMDFAHDVCGSAACYFDPFDPASIRDAILTVKDAPGKRDALVAEGAKRFECYVRDWDSIVREAVQQLEELTG